MTILRNVSIGLFLVVASLLAGCTPQSTDRTSSSTGAPDNTGVNERDRDGALKTPLDQGQNSADVELTAKIRRRILDVPGLSVNGRNVKVISSNGKVTLRGPVATVEERDSISKIATDEAGASNVDSQLEIEK